MHPSLGLRGSDGGRSSGYSLVQMVRNAEGQWEDCRDNYIAGLPRGVRRVASRLTRLRAASAALRFREGLSETSNLPNKRAGRLFYG
jgi:hypothetical protein